MNTQTIQTYQALIICIYHQDDPHPCTVRAEDSGLILKGFNNLTDAAKWLKLNGGEITSDIIETEKGYCRKAQLPIGKYHYLVSLQTEKKAA